MKNSVFINSPNVTQNTHVCTLELTKKSYFAKCPGCSFPFSGCEQK